MLIYEESNYAAFSNIMLICEESNYAAFSNIMLICEESQLYSILQHYANLCSIF
jgi:hypothetical protein